MSESRESINQLEAGIRRRLRMLAVQDLIALSVLVSAGVVLVALLLLKLGLFQNRIGEGIGTGGRLLLSGIPLAAAGAVLAFRWLLKGRVRWRSNLEADADHTDLIIDQTLDLDDRVRTAGCIIRRGGPATLMETALVEDAASRLGGTLPGRFVAYRPPRLDSALRCHTSVACSIVLALIALVALIQYRLAKYGSQGPDPEAVAVMQAVGDDLEKTTQTIGQSVATDTPTAELARQQADLAHALKEAGRPETGSRTRPIGRAQALKELSALGEKLGSRKNELENTRASEILSLAERRFQSALSGTTSVRHQPVARHQGTLKKAVADKPETESATQNKRDLADKRGDSRKPDSADISSERSAESNPRSAESNSAGKNGAEQSQDDLKPSGLQPDGMPAVSKDEPQAVSSQKDSGGDPVTGMLPNLSEDLIKKAAQMRANNLTPADIEQFRKAAEGLLKDLSAKDLANLANSKEIQQTLEQLARQVNPKQMEELARQLLSQKEIRDELQAVGKLLMENRQAKETIAGFADKAKEIAKLLQEQGYKPAPPRDLASSMGMTPPGSPRAGDGPGSGGRGARRSYGRSSDGAETLNGARNGPDRSGQSTRHSGKAEDNAGSSREGEPIYGRARPGSAPARVPYSAAYPGYRREAERSVQRSQVPPHLRDLIRNYFDAINPDATRKP